MIFYRLKDIAQLRLDSLRKKVSEANVELAELQNEKRMLDSNLRQCINTRQNKLDEEIRELQIAYGSAYIRLKTNAAENRIDAEIINLKLQASQTSISIKDVRKRLQKLKLDLHLAFKKQEKWSETCKSELAKVNKQKTTEEIAFEQNEFDEQISPRTNFLKR